MKDTNKIVKKGNYYSLREIRQDSTYCANKGSQIAKKYFKRQTNKLKRRVYNKEIENQLIERED